MRKVKLNFWADADLKEAIKKRAKNEDRDISNFLRHKIQLVRRQEKW